MSLLRKRRTSADEVEQRGGSGTYWQRKSQQVSSWWSTLRKGRWQRSAPSAAAKRTKRLCSSHPDVSHNDLAAELLLDGAPHSAGASLSSSPNRLQADTPPTPQRRLPPLDPFSAAAAELLPATPPPLHTVLRQHPFYELDVWLRCGRDLVAKDACGTSDPYVKFKLGGKLVHRSRTVQRNLNPDWNERFVLPVEDVFQSVALKVFDYDWGLHDDFMGAATFDLAALEPRRPTDLSLALAETRKGSAAGDPAPAAGYIDLVVTLLPRSQEEKEQYMQRHQRLADASRKLKSQIWSGVVSVVLVQGRNLSRGPGAVCVKFRLGAEKYKSKSCQRTSDPWWREQFDLHLYDGDQALELTVLDGRGYRDDVIGRCVIELGALERECTHRLWQRLDSGDGALFLLLTISGTTESISDLSAHDSSGDLRRRLRQRYRLGATLENVRDVGHLTVKVYEARDLASADLGGKSDPFCVLELVNARLQTQTEYKTLSPSWHKIFTFNVKDIHSVLELTVYDEDRDRKVEFLGKVAVPLLRVRNGERRWYALKDKRLEARVKGQVLLEMDVVFNPARACLRTFGPREAKFTAQEQKFKKRVFVANVVRVRQVVRVFLALAQWVQGCLEWESAPRSAAAFLAFVVVVYNFQLYMLPLGLLALFAHAYVTAAQDGPGATGSDCDAYAAASDDDDERGEKKSLKERLLAIQEVILSVQVALGKIASVGESVKNTFNFSVPFLSWLAIVLLCLAAVLLYLVPLRWLVIVWGVNKFTRKLRAPHAVANNELLDFLSRVPDDEQLRMYREAPLDSDTSAAAAALDRKGRKKKSL